MRRCPQRQHSHKPPSSGPGTSSPPAGVLTRFFYARATLDVARDLLGKVLVHDSRAGRTSGVIVETEGYVGEGDPACHAAAGLTPRNAPLYGEPGFAYVYLNYGVHYLLNAVTEPKGSPAAVLIRALEPLEGIDLMRRRRTPGQDRPAGSLSHHDLCRGPGNLTRAMGITQKDNLADLCGPRLYIENRALRRGRIRWSSRIGIRVGLEHDWRCYVVGSPAVSGGRSAATGKDAETHRGARRASF
ncbi:MAG: DNA-3-methyladenine glycosylase [Acidobacteria bacterium]|nr:DNA-3-methyladenine glycosylase [Acidobacteriota bacterium]